MGGIILYWITALFARKNNLIIKSEIKATNKELVASLKYINIKVMIRNNFDIKPAILKLFFSSFWINLAFIAFSALANIIYTWTFFYNFFDCQIPGLEKPNWPWIGILIINILFVVFAIRLTSAYYKLSLRGNYRNNYLKLLWLDIITLNILDIIGSLLFFKNKSQMLRIPDNYQINHNTLNSQPIKDYLKLIIKIEIFTLVINLIVFLIALLTGYFVKNNSIKWICLVIIFWNMIVLYAWSIPRMIGMIIFHKMFKNLLKNNDYFYLLSTIRFLVFAFGYYYLAILVNLFKDQNFKEFIIENW